MTVREYIGARYVPLYIGIWDNTVAYEPLSIVQYQGSSYTSRQSVPIGIDITNETYWICSADYNAQVEAYHQEVLAYNGRITSLESALPIADFDNVNTVDARFDAIELQMPVFNVKAYGAKGDGVTDDTQAFQDAIDAAGAKEGSRILIPMGAGEKYIISSTLDVDSAYLTFYTPGNRSIAWQNAGIYFTAQNDILFDVTKSGAVFDNLLIVDADGSNTCIRAKMDSYPDTDIDIVNCDFSSFDTVIEHYDRGLKFQNNTARHCQNVVTIQKDAFMTDSGTNRMRGIVIRDNRLHSCHKAVTLTDCELYGIIISGNMMDYSEPTEQNILLYSDATSKLYNLSLVNNIILDARDYVIQVLGEIWYSVISGNIMNNRVVATSNGHFQFEKAAYSTISDNEFGACPNDSIEIKTADGVKIIGNTWANAAQGTTDNFACVHIVTNMNRSIISSNLMMLQSYSQGRCVKYSGSNAVTYNRVTNNMSNRTEIWTNVNSATESNNNFQATMIA